MSKPETTPVYIPESCQPALMDVMEEALAQWYSAIGYYYYGATFPVEGEPGGTAASNPEGGHHATESRTTES